MLVFAVVVALQTAGDDTPSLVRRYFAEPDQRTQILKLLATRPLDEISRAIPAARVYESAEPGIQTRHAPHPLTAGAPDILYMIRIPPHDPAKLHRLLVSLHGSHGRAVEHIGFWRDAEIKREDGLFLACPEAGTASWGRSLMGFGHVLGPIRDILQHFPIDPDRIHVDGESMGGNGSFQFACHFPDIVATLSSRIGGPEYVRPDRESETVIPRFLENLRNVPVHWIVGSRDEVCPIDWVRGAKARMTALGVDLDYNEMDGGHEFYDEMNPRVLDWMRDRRRNPYPETVHWVTDERRSARSYWVEILDFSKGADERILRSYLGSDGSTVEERKHFVHQVTVKAVIDRKQNTIRATTGYVKTLRFHLNDSLLDLDREVRVFVNGSLAVSKKALRSVDVLMESALRDRGMLFTTRIDVPVK